MSTLPSYENFNTYTISLFELSACTTKGAGTKYKEIDICVDERLCTRPDGHSLLGGIQTHLGDSMQVLTNAMVTALPTQQGELWPCYLEKAVAAHCGGWDKICGGQCTHAWRLLLGCEEVYTIKKIEGPGLPKYRAFGTLNPHTGQHETLANSPHDGFIGEWPMAWPEVHNVWQFLQ